MRSATMPPSEHTRFSGVRLSVPEKRERESVCVCVCVCVCERERERKGVIRRRAAGASDGLLFDRERTIGWKRAFKSRGMGRTWVLTRLLTKSLERPGDGRRATALLSLPFVHRAPKKEKRRPLGIRFRSDRLLVLHSSAPRRQASFFPSRLRSAPPRDLNDSVFGSPTYFCARARAPFPVTCLECFLSPLLFA